MTTRTIYFDESGFTGYNLLDTDQPIFAIASADIAEERAEEVLRHSFPEYQGAEYKFSNVWNSRSRRGLLTFAGHLSDREELTYLYVIDKRFAVLTKIVDLLVEPYITDAGYNFYDDGFCWKYCNYIYYGFTQFALPELLEALLTTYQAFSRNPTLEGLATLRNHLSLMAKSSPQPVQIFLEQMELGAQLFPKYHDLEKFRSSNELQVSTMLAIVSRWRQKFPENFAIVHDTSSSFLRGKKFWERVTSDKVPPQQLPAGDGTFVEYPLRIVSTTAVDSKNSRSIQFCDILAGLAARHFNPRTEEEDRKFMDKAIDAGLSSITYNGIRPSRRFPDQIPPKRLQGPDAVDLFTKVMFGQHHNR